MAGEDPDKSVNRTGYVIREKVDIYAYPAACAMPSSDDEVVTLGDLHGNTARLVQMLLREGLLTTTGENFTSFIQLYKASAGAYDLNAYMDSLSAFDAARSSPNLRLIGDDLADRGNNDVLTLLMFSRLQNLNFNVEIIASNHGVEFLKQYACGLMNPLEILYTGSNSAFGKSLYGLRADITKGVITESDVDELIRAHYLPNMKLLSYSITSPGHIAIYSHAPIQENKIKSLAESMGVDFNADTAENLAKSIDAINAAFKEIVSDREKLKMFFAMLEKFPDKSRIFDDFVNDRYEELKPTLNAPSRPYTVSNIHGHVGERTLNSSPVNNWGYVNLDSDLGKSEATNVRAYPAHVSQESQFKPALTISDAVKAASKPQEPLQLPKSSSPRKKKKTSSGESTTAKLFARGLIGNGAENSAPNKDAVTEPGVRKAKTKSKKRRKSIDAVDLRTPPVKRHP